MHILKQIFIAVAVLASVFEAMAELPDSLTVKPSERTDSIAEYLRPIGENPLKTGAMSGSGWLEYSPEYIDAMASLHQAPAMVEPLRVAAVETPSLFSWDGGGLSTMGRMQSLPGLAGVGSGSLMLTQTVGRVSFMLYGGASKMAYFRGLQTAYMFGGMLDFRISERMSLTVFGSYSTGMRAFNPALAAYMPTSNFGGYLSYDFSDHWGMSVGGQYVKSVMTNRYEFQPIVKPYYKLNKKVSIGVDVGAIIYGIAKEYIDSRNRGRGPMPPPPVQRGIR